MKPSSFLDDAPKLEPEEDRLGYKKFAERLATALAGIRAPNGYVVGVQAPWGSGKSTALNFVKAYLHANADDDVVILDYSPWLISGHQDLIEGFFKVLAEAVDRKTVAREAMGRKAKRMAASAADPVFKAIGEVSAALNPEWGESVKPAAAAAGSTVKKALDAWAKDPSLQTAHQGLRAALRKSKRRFIVFIDDLDRLDAEEVRSIARMVKSVGGLPNVIYVLAYDRAIIRRALDGTAATDPSQPNYDEKIVQHEVSLPTPARRSLSRALDEHTEFLIGPTVDSARWHDIVRNGTDRWIRSIRDVVRLSNAVAFAAPALDGELDSQDLLAMEGLRLFDDTAFAWVRNNRDFLLGEGRAIYLGEGETVSLVKALHDAVPTQGREQVIALLCTLFPTRAKQLTLAERPTFMSGESYGAIAARRGIATADGYSAYFSLSGTTASVSKRDVDQVVENLDDSGVIRAALDKYLNRHDDGGFSLIPTFLEELRFRIEGPIKPTQALLDQLLRIGDEIIALDDLGSGFDTRPLRYFSELVDAILRRIGPKKAGEMLAAAFNQASSAAIVADVYVDRGRELGVFPSATQRHQPLITKARLDVLSSRVKDLINEAAIAGTLEGAPRYWDIVRAWKQVGENETATRWIRERAEVSAPDFAKIALGFLAYSVGTKGRYYFLNERPADEDFSLEELHRLSLKHVDDPGLTAGEKLRIEALRVGTEKMLSDPNATRVEPGWDEDDAEVDDE